MPEKFIKLFTHPGETVLDPFCGSGTTNVEAKRLGRDSIGIDINAYSTGMTLHRLAEVDMLQPSNTKHQIIQGNCVDVMDKIPKQSIDFIITSPPYFDVVDYKDNHPEQWGNIHDYSTFVDKAKRAFEKMHNIMKPNGYVVVVTQDVYKKYAKCPLHADYIFICRKLGFEIISTQIYILNYSTGGRLVYGYPKSYYPKNDNEFIVIFRKENK